ncbi:Nuclear-interacting partner of ALK [Phytophthora citrophthora]|uniref:Nuclear-interacting partner of ALK n=1 Tax=Phytophthora citrophthora TaxID=4793 RepID=A0AAD9GRB6_9STRA|nr:Nuclear-interacting partner of ALK [Phytophthora citrophthora]
MKVEALLSAWEDATAPIDARVRENPVLFTSGSDGITTTRFKRLKGPESDDLCRPWDHSDFLTRVGSFSIGSWFAKPDVISAFECARHGWRNSAPDQLYCNCCTQFLCFKIDDKLSEAGALKVAKMFNQQLVSGHTQLCPWRGNPSPEAFTTLPIATKRQVFEIFLNRMDKEVTKMNEIAEFQKQMEDTKVANSVLTKVLKAVFAGDAAEPLDVVTLGSKLLARVSHDQVVSSEALVNAALLIICGWQFDPSDDNHNSTLWCGSCNRRWAVVNKSVNDEGSEPPTKRLKANDALQPVDLLSQHRHFCPWLIERKSTGVEDYGESDPKLWEFVKLAGWDQYAQSLMFLGNSEDGAIVAAGSDSIRTRCPVEALESVQAVLGL